MDRATDALVSMRYFQAERLALKALDAAHRARDYDRMSRICLPLQEARRQKRQLALDAGVVTVVAEAGARLREPGFYLVQPPAVGIDARRMREDADRRETPVSVLTREPLTLAGRWPIVAANGDVSVRTQVDPPWPLERVQDSPTRDRASGPPDTSWFLWASETLGDAAIAQVNPDDPPAYQVEDLLEFLDCHPDHEKLHQRLADACRVCVGVPPPELSRRAARMAYGRWKRIGRDEY